MRSLRLWCALLAAFALVMGQVGCAGGASEQPSDAQTTSDQAGQESPTDATNEAPGEEEPVVDVLAEIDASSRVVAVSRSVAEMWLLAGGKLTGASEDALTLQGIDEDVQSVGDSESPDLEQVLSLKPDLVMLAQDGAATQELRSGLDEAQVPVLVVDVDSFDDYADAMASLAACTGRDDLYEQNVTRVGERIDEVLAHNDQSDRGTYLAICASPDENVVLKADHFACAMLGDLGLSNVADGTTSLDDLSLDAIAAADPDWVFVIYAGEGGEAQQAFAESLTNDPAWQELAAAERDHVVALPSYLFLDRPNARWAEAYGYLSQVLHGAWA